VSDTPRTDEFIGEYSEWSPAKPKNWPAFSRQLERQFNTANDRIKRLEEALTWYESTVSDCNRHGPEGDVARDALAKDQGRKAKEVKL